MQIGCNRHISQYSMLLMDVIFDSITTEIKLTIVPNLKNENNSMILLSC